MLAYTFYESDNRVRRYAESLVKNGAEVDVIALKSNDHEDTDVRINGVRIFKIQKRLVNERGKLSYLIRITRFLLKSFVFLARKDSDRRYDLIHVHNVPDFEVFAALIPKARGAKIILDIHDILPEFYMSKFSENHNSFIYKLLRIVEKASIRFADHVIIANHIWYDVLVNRSTTKEKCTAIANYPDPSIFHKQHRNGKNDKFLILYPGTLNWHQGLDIAIRAFGMIKDQVPEAVFYIYGGGPTKSELVNLVAQLGLETRVYFKESLPIDEIATVMAKSDLGIVPKRANSFGNEAFSTKIMEFMALGVPVIVSDTKIDKYYFDDSLVMFFESENEKDLSQKMLMLIKDKMTRVRLVTNSLKFIEENNWEVKKNLYLDIVNKLVGTNNQGS